MAPADTAKLPEIVVLINIARDCPTLSEPPATLPLLPTMAQLLATRLPTLKIAEPLFDEMTHSFKHNSPERFTKPYSRPCVIVSPEIATLPLPIRYTWLESLPLT